MKRSAHESQTLSKEALDFIGSHRPFRLPFIPFSKPLARLIRRKDAQRKTPALALLKEDVRIEEQIINGCRFITIEPKAGLRSQTTGFYLHGGAFLLGQPLDYSVMALSLNLGIRILSLEYPLSPESTFPATINYCFTAYQGLVKLYPDFVALGSSAGGNLLVVTLLSALEHSCVMPQAVGLFSPWLDLTGSGESYAANEGRDCVIGWKNQLDRSAKIYAGKAGVKDSRISVLFAHYPKAFPPCLIISGSRDLLLSDAQGLYERLKAAGSSVKLSIYQGLWHGFNTLAHLPEGEQARQEMTHFFNAYLTYICPRKYPLSLMQLTGRIVAIESHGLSEQVVTYSLELHVSRADTRLLRISKAQFETIQKKGLSQVRLEIDRNSGFVESIDYL